MQARALVRVPGSEHDWQPPPGASRATGYACMSNSCDTVAEANSTVVFLVDDTGPGIRPKGYDPRNAPTRLNAEASSILPLAAYLLAKRDIKPGEEIRWRYQVALR